MEGVAAILAVAIFTAYISFHPKAPTFAAEPELTTIKLPKQECRPGTGPEGRRPQRRVETKGAVQEDLGDATSDTTVRIRLDGTLDVTTFAVALDDQCKYKRAGILKVCSWVSGKEECRDTEKTTEIAQSMADLFDRASTPAGQNRIAADQIYQHALHHLLNPNVGKEGVLLNDAEGLVITKSFDIEGSSRVITLPTWEASEIAADPRFYERILTYVERQRLAGIAPANIPISTVPGNRYTYSDSNLLLQQMTESGAQIRYYYGAPEPVWQAERNGTDQYGYPSAPWSFNRMVDPPYVVTDPETLKSLRVPISTFSTPLGEMRRSIEISQASNASTYSLTNMYNATLDTVRNSYLATRAFFGI